MNHKHSTSIALVAVALAISPATALAQDVADPVADPYATVERDDDDFPWGLLGLLGLAGLLGMKRRDHDHVVRRDDPRV